MESTSIPGDVGFAYLDHARADEFFADLKARTIRVLAIGAGDRVVDVGCGTGEEVAAMAASAPEVVALGVDLSERSIDEARRRHGRRGDTFLVGDARALPIEDGDLAACRVERTVQHVPEPARMVRELARVLRPGGRVVITEPDWKSCALAGADEAVSALVLDAWSCHSVNPSAGRNLVSLLGDAKLRVLSVRAESVIYRTLEDAELAYPLTTAGRAAAANGLIASEVADHWIADLAAASIGGDFAFAVPLFTVVGERRLAALSMRKVAHR